MRHISIAVALLATVASTSLAAAPAPERYDLQLRITRQGTLVAAPRLISRAGEAATFMSDDGKRNSWSIKLKAMPDVAHDGHVTVDWSMTFTQPIATGGISTRSTSTTLSMRDPGHAALDLPAAGPEVAPLHVELAIARMASGG
ncbi:hypothetical protein QH494_25615 [Sphingomonas sp. AR_OL41]|uniref:hypothetical protein n=1 Tax=Sphingomonas sp. AR_OL41 TaxID=3042729 RepID=UPI0024813CD6|nr:hypothetical protein [Sphingomonas sp. AR_OL41]MDH7975576.1 hypothetical protein [Sphingomonas sp. AR_OL41]